MTQHRRPAGPSKRRSGRTRALLSLAAVGVLATGMSVKGTFAFWTDSATAATGSFSAGTLDITVNGQLAGQANNGGSTTVASLTLGSMVPGESIAATFPVANNGSVPLTYNLTGTGSGGLAVTNGMQYSVTFGGTATNTGSAATGNRAGSCGAVATDTNTTLLTSTASTFATARALAAGASDTVCVVARLSSQAPNALQGLSGTASLVFDSKQVGA
ncbi:TasA family protein [Nocardioides rubriscoriae]|uniref:TasA family protein n=1 Tax=Nocardioides rubriscoriae TaxID=642762 RepID=UPI0011DF9C0E|nr:TasA family protein [Nocardioides rubriscoriae]